MAQIERREGKKGVSYLITVSCGKDSNGKQIRHRKTYTPPQTWSETRQAKEALKVATTFEAEIKKGYILDNRQTFAEYAKYTLDIKRREGKKESTLERYTELLDRINPEIGHLKLVDIRPAHLNKLYEKLGKDGGRKTIATATAKVDLSAELKQRKLTKTKFAETAGVPSRAVSQACKAPVSEVIANKIASALNGKMNQYFTLERDLRPLSEKTILEHHRLISTILSQAEREMLVPYNAAAKASPPKPKIQNPNYFQPEQVYAILDAADAEPLKYRAFINLVVVTGARRGELAGLKWSKVNFENGQITIDCALLYSHKRGVYEGDTKTGEHRQLKIPQEVIALLKRLWTEQSKLRLKMGDRWHDTGYIFTQDDGTPVNPQTWTQWMSKFSKRHKLPHINPHAFRHTAASVLIANHVDHVTVSKMLGHSSPTTTEKFYSHLIEEAKASASDTITEVLLRRNA